MSAERAAAPGTPSALRPVAVDSVVVPMSSSASAEIALSPAADVARHFGARTTLLGVAVEEAEAEVMAKRLAVLADPLGAVVETRVSSDVPLTILEVARRNRPALVCMASHGRGRLGELVLGSYAAGVLAAAPHPVMLAGPDLEPGRRLRGGPVMACVDGSANAERSLAVASSWAAELGVALEIVTVVARRGDPNERRSGHHIQRGGTYPDSYVDALVEQWSRPGLAVAGRVLEDDAGPGSGLARHLATAPGSLLVATTHARTGLARLALGSEAAAIVRSSPVPVLVVPPERG